MKRRGREGARGERERERGSPNEHSEMCVVLRKGDVKIARCVLLRPFGVYLVIVLNQGFSSTWTPHPLHATPGHEHMPERGHMVSRHIL